MFEAKWSTIEQKIELLEAGQKELNQRMEKITEQVAGLENKNHELDKAFRLLEDDFKQLMEVQRVIENVDNNLRKNNLRLKGMKEEA